MASNDDNLAIGCALISACAFAVVISIIALAVAVFG